MFDPLYQLIANTLRANPKVIFDGQYDVDGGQTFTVSFTAKHPAPNNQADLDLSEVFAAFPYGFAIQRLANINHTTVRLPVSGHDRVTEEQRGSFLLTVTKANWVKGLDGEPVVSDCADEDSLDDILQRYRKLPEAKQKIFIKFARTFLKGVAL